MHPFQADFRNFLLQIHPVPEQVLNQYLQHWVLWQAPAKTIISQAGVVEKHIYFVLEGIQKSYYQNEDKQHIMEFAYPPSFSGVLESFFTQSPSYYVLESITDSTFLRLSHHSHQKLLEENRSLETLFRKATEQFLKGVIQRHHELMAFDIKTRFKIFAKRSAHLFNMIPHKDLASYLRIDATNFSKLINSVRIE